MQVDVLLDTFGVAWDDVRDAAVAAADGGFNGIWVFDHVDGRVYDAPHVLEGWTILSALAVAVPGVMLGPMVLNVANRPPGIVAGMAATLQDVSGGRLLLGLGAGARAGTPYAREQQTIGQRVLRDEQRRRQVERSIADIRRLWRLPGFLHPVPEPPVIVAAHGEKMADLAGRRADGITLPASHPRLRELVEVARDSRRRAGGEQLLVTVLAQLEDPWLDPDSSGRQRLTAVGVDRVVLLVPLPADPARLTVPGVRLRR
ncbi:MAG TPA: LLM class flavin-dependent oxidoreductase [Acidimicrobiia bacterium]